jgi:hypothetical protein
MYPYRIVSFEVKARVRYGLGLLMDKR